MKILDRYIGITIVSHVVVVMMVLLAMFFFTSFIRELDDIGRGSYGLGLALAYVVLILPQLAYQLFPLMVLIGSILGLGVLASNSELTMIRAAGVSIARIILSVLKVGVFLIILATLVGEFVAPDLEQYAQNMRSAALANKISLESKSGIWTRDGDRFVHIADLYADGSLGNIEIYEMKNKRQLSTITRAKHAYYYNDKWTLTDITRSVITEDNVTSEKLPNMNWESLLKPDLIGVVAVKPNYLSVWGLYKYLNYLNDNGLDSAQYALAFWNKIFAPLTNAVMIFIAIPFVFGPLRSVSVGMRVMAGTLTGIGFYGLSQVSNYLGLLYEMNPVVTILVAPVLFLAGGIYFTKRIF